MSRTKSAKYDYPKEGISLSDISKKMYNKSYCETTKNEERKIKLEYKKLNK